MAASFSMSGIHTLRDSHVRFFQAFNVDCPLLVTTPQLESLLEFVESRSSELALAARGAVLDLIREIRADTLPGLPLSGGFPAPLQSTGEGAAVIH